MADAVRTVYVNGVAFQIEHSDTADAHTFSAEQREEAARGVALCMALLNTIPADLRMTVVLSLTATMLTEFAAEPAVAWRHFQTTLEGAVPQLRAQ